MSSAFHINLAVLIAGAVLLLLGLSLLKRSLWPRRVGDERRCRRCGYQLQGIDSPRCPECGTELTPANVVHGHRERRPGLAVISVLVLLLPIGGAVVGGVAAYNRIDWYQYRPTSWLIGDLSSPTPATVTRAWGEINRRILIGQFPHDQDVRLADKCITVISINPINPSDPAWAELMRQDISGTLDNVERLKLIDWALRAQQASPKSALLHLPMDWLCQQLVAGRLPSDRRDAYVSRLVVLHLATRPQLVQDGALPYIITDDERGPDRMWYCGSNGKELLDGVEVGGGGGEYMSATLSDSNTDYGTVETAKLHLKPGPHKLTVQVRQSFFLGPPPANWDNFKATIKPFIDQTTSCTATFTVLPRGTADPIENVSTPELAKSMPVAFRIRQVRISRHNNGVEIHIGKTPESFAFNVIVLIDGKEHSVGSINGPQNDESLWNVGAGDLDVGKQTTVSVILRSSDDVARQTVNLTRIWKGEIRFDGVPVEKSKN